MVQNNHNPEQIKAYRQAATELHKLFINVEQRMGAAAEVRDPQAADNALSELETCIDGFKKLRETLNPEDIFIAKYNVEVINRHTISFVIPSGVSRLEILKEAHALVTDRDLIHPEQLIEWQDNPKFTAIPNRSECIRINGHVNGSTEKSRAEQEAFLKQKKLEMPALEDLSLAFAAHYIATREALFGWYDKPRSRAFGARAAGDLLRFNSSGLYVGAIDDEYRLNVIAVAARLPAELKS